ncbi:MAG: anti-sigma factor family protein [Kiloniellaceae bacterium]
MKPAWPDHNSPGNDNAVAEDDLQAYVDGQLDSRRRAAIEAYLAARPGEAARLAAYRAQNIGLHALFDPCPGSPAPDDSLPPRMAALAGALDAKLKDAATSAPGSRRFRSLAASVALLLAAGTSGWMALDHVGWRDDSLVTFTRQATQIPALPAAEAQSGKRQVVTWLAAQPGDVPATVPDLKALGFRLAGERVLAGNGGPPAAQLLYQDETGKRVTLTMRAGGKAGKTSFTFTRDGEAARFVWQDAHMAYSLAGSMAQEQLLELAEAVSRSLRDSDQATPQQEAADTTAPLAAGQGTQNAGDGNIIVPPDAAPPATGSGPLLDKSPLIPVPLPEAADQAKET